MRQKKCRVDGCTLAYRSRDYCWKHLAGAKAAGEEIVDYRSRGPLPDVQCRVDGCESLSVYKIKKLCGKHYQRLKTYGSFDLPEPPTMREVLEGGRAISASGCWEWTGAVATTGYGRFGAGEYVHRLSHEVYKGPIPEGHQVDHLCRNRVCFNPDHIEAVTQEENLRRQLMFMERNEIDGRLVRANG